MRTGHVFELGRVGVVVTTGQQAGGAPFLDDAGVQLPDLGRFARGVAIVPPWRLRRQSGAWRTAEPCRALVLARLT